jgi:hypothetical protein
MEMIPVKSSNLNSVGYDAINLTLDIKFHEGHVYRYFKVPLNIYNGLMTAISHGKYFDQYIKGHYRFIKIR